MGMISELRRNVARELVGMGMGDLQKDGSWMRSEGQYGEGLILSSLTAGLYPNVVMRQGGEQNFSTALGRKCKIHLSSVNSLRGQVSNDARVRTSEGGLLCGVMPSYAG
jgi:hypothetical protein